MENTKKVLKAIESSEHGLTITEIVYKTKTGREAVRIGLAYLTGQGKIKYRKVGMAKVYIDI